MTTPEAGLAELDVAIGSAAAVGLRVDVELAGDPRPLPAVVVDSARRVVEESLAGVLAPAGAASATVAVRFAPGAVVLRIAGAAPPAAGAAALRTLARLTDRVAAIGGGLTARRDPDAAGRFRVQAWLPTEGQPT